MSIKKSRRRNNVIYGFPQGEKKIEILGMVLRQVLECVLQRLCTSNTRTEPHSKYSDCWFYYFDSLGGIGVAQE
jgi:hypothetical protein